MAVGGKRMSSQPPAFLTPAEYLEIERPAEWKSEYFQGEMVEMPHPNYRHCSIVMNLICKLGNRLEEGPFGLYGSNLRLRVAAIDFYTYPDIMVICGYPEMDGDQDDIVLNPVLIADVLSEPTQDYDRGEKFQRYQNLPSLLEYLTVAQNAPRIEQWIRQPDGPWLLAISEGMDARIQLASIDCSLPLAEIYDRIDFSW
jgi:Uma2 family endonuclease